MAIGSFTQVFGGALTYPSQPSLLELSLQVDTVLQWPTELSSGPNVVADIIDVTPGSAGLSITMPSALSVSVGNPVLFFNAGSDTFAVLDNDGSQIVSLTSGTAWEIYLTDNTTNAGTWRGFQFGATVSVVNAAALAGAGLKAIGTTLNQAVAVTTVNSNYTIGSADRAKFFVWNGGAGTLSLSDPGTLGNDWFVQVRNAGSGSISVTPLSGTINGASSLTFNPGDSAFIVTDGATFYTIGFGQSVTNTFDYVQINVAGSGNFTLSGSQLNRIAYKFTGVLTGNREIIVPSTVQQYWVDNSTTGAFTLSVGTAAQVSPVVIGQGTRAILYCDGTNVVDADTSTVSVPISIADGGTGATTASQARINLGGTSTGIAIFTAASAGAVRTLLSVPTIDDAIIYAVALG